MSGTARKPLLACVLTLALAGCGGDSGESGTLTEDQAAGLQQTATQVENYFNAGRCEEASEEADRLVAAIDDLPAEVGKDVKDPLREMAQNLEDLANEECEGSESESQPEPEPTTPPVTTVDPTTATDTTEEPDPSEDEEEDEDQPEEEDEQPQEPDPPEPAPEPEPPTGPPPGQQPEAPGNSNGTGGVGEEDRR